MNHITELYSPIKRLEPEKTWKQLAEENILSTMHQKSLVICHVYFRQMDKETR